MTDWISISTLITVTALFLLTWSTAGPKRRPILALFSFVMIAFGLASRFATTSGLLYIIAGMLTDLGIGQVVSSVYLAKRRKPPKALASLGVFLMIAAVFLRMAGAGVDAFTDSQPPAKTVSGQFLLELGPDDQLHEVASTLDAYDAYAERAFPGLTLADDENLAQYYIVHADEERIADLMKALRRDAENVDHVEYNLEVGLVPLTDVEETEPLATKAFANDPMIGNQWWFDQIGIDEVHRLLHGFRPAKKAIVAILDTGVDAAHEDLSATFGNSPGTKDENGHGTHCAGIAGAVANNGQGIASLNWEGQFLEIRSYQVLSGSGIGTSEMIAQGIIDATRGGADVVSLSLGSWAPVAPKVQRDAVNFALKRNVVVVAAAGNSSSDAREHAPSNIEGVISVAAIDANGRRASFSNTNTRLTRPLSAPGVGILSSKPGNTYAKHNGTSMATPVVSGIAGLLRALNPDLTPAEVYDLLHTSGDELTDVRSVGRTVHAGRAVEEALRTAPIVAAVPPL